MEDAEEAFEDDVDQDVGEENFDEGADQEGEGQHVVGGLSDPDYEWEHTYI